LVEVRGESRNRQDGSSPSGGATSLLPNTVKYSKKIQLEIRPTEIASTPLLGIAVRIKQEGSGHLQILQAAP